MKIGIADNQQLKFDQDLVDHWKERGHEVRYEMGFSEYLAEWADLYYINYWDNNVHAAYHWHQNHPEWKRPIYAVRAIDWEVWCGLVRDQSIIDWVDHAFCIAPHIERKLRSESQWGEKLHLIQCGINLERFTPKKTYGRYNIVLPCNEIDWHLKNVSEGFKIFAMLRKRYARAPHHLFVRGKWCQGEYFKVFHQDLIDKLGIRDCVTIIDQPVDDYNAFLEDMDYCLVPSYKEAFSYVTGECAAKGIKPVLNWWYGAEEIWPKEWLYTTPDQAVDMLSSDFVPHQLRKYIEKEKNVKTMFQQFDKVLGT